MRLSEVVSLLGPAGVPIEADLVAGVRDWTQQANSPTAIKPAVVGDRIFEWRDGPAPSTRILILVAFDGGVVVDKARWHLSL